MADGIPNRGARLKEAEEGKCGRPLRGGDRKGLPCRRESGAGTDHLGEGACWLHGGRSLRGAAHPAFKHGRYSKHWASVGERMQTAIEDLASDPDYLHLRRHIATLDYLFLEEVGQLDSANGGGGWSEVRKLTADLSMAISGGNVGGIQRAIKQLRILADSGVRRDKALTRVQSLIRDRVHATRADQSRVEAEQAYATVEQLKQIALLSAQSVATQLDLFMRQLLTSLSEPERLRVQEPFDALRRATLQGVSESFRRALVGHALPSDNGVSPNPESPPLEAPIVVEAVDPTPAHTQAPRTGTHPPQPSNAVPIPGLSNA